MDAGLPGRISRPWIILPQASRLELDAIAVDWRFDLGAPERTRPDAGVFRGIAAF